LGFFPRCVSVSVFWVCAAIVCLMFMPPLQAQRLPTDVTPQHYALTLEPNLKAATFTGKEQIDVTLARPMTSITLNAAQIRFQNVTITADGKTQTARVTENRPDEQATFHVANELSPGDATIRIEYSGILNNQPKLCGHTV
jgi:aminopeptidase N